MPYRLQMSKQLMDLQPFSTPTTTSHNDISKRHLNGTWTSGFPWDPWCGRSSRPPHRCDSSRSTSRWMEGWSRRCRPSSWSLHRVLGLFGLGGSEVNLGSVKITTGISIDPINWYQLYTVIRSKWPVVPLHAVLTDTTSSSKPWAFSKLVTATSLRPVPRPSCWLCVRSGSWRTLAVQSGAGTTQHHPKDSKTIQKEMCRNDSKKSNKNSKFGMNCLLLQMQSRHFGNFSAPQGLHHSQAWELQSTAEGHGASSEYTAKSWIGGFYPFLASWKHVILPIMDGKQYIFNVTEIQSDSNTTKILKEKRLDKGAQGLFWVRRRAQKSRLFQLLEPPCCDSKESLLQHFEFILYTVVVWFPRLVTKDDYSSSICAVGQICCE